MTEKLAWLFLEWRRFLQKRLVGYDISLPQLSLLKKLLRQDFMIPSEIAEYMHCDRPTASVIIRNLEKKELIYRKKGEQNAKYHRLSISKKGKEFLAYINAQVPPLDISPFDGLSLEESEQLYGLLTKCCDRMKDIKDQKTGE